MSEPPTTSSSAPTAFGVTHDSVTQRKGAMQPDSTRLTQGYISSTQYRVDPNEDVHIGLEPPPSPWKKVALAVFLLVLGTILLCTGIGIWFSSNPEEHSLPFLIIGSITFIPGSYYSWIAYGAWRGYKGFNLNLIPDY